MVRPAWAHFCGCKSHRELIRILVQKGDHLLELSRYIVLNPVRANMVQSMDEWHWSSYRAVIGLDAGGIWFDRDWLLNQFGETRSEAILGYQKFIAEGVGLPSPMANVRNQLFLGDEDFVASQRKKRSGNEPLRELSMAQKRIMAKTLDEYMEANSDRNTAMANAYYSGSYTMKEIGDHFGVHYMTVSRAVRNYEQTGRSKTTSY